MLFINNLGLIVLVLIVVSRFFDVDSGYCLIWFDLALTDCLVGCGFRCWWVGVIAITLVWFGLFALFVVVWYCCLCGIEFCCLLTVLLIVLLIL